MKKLLLYLLIFPVHLLAQDVTQHIRTGNEYYAAGQYQMAVTEYQKALQLEPGNRTAQFNHASALYKAGLQVEASQKFTEMATATGDKGFRAKAYYNKGAILSAQKNIEESIEAYKSALRLDPDDQQARENLQKALLELKKKNPPEPKQDQQKQNKDQQQQRNQSRLDQNEADQRLRLLNQKERETQERTQKDKARAGGGGTGKDW